MAHFSIAIGQFCPVCHAHNRKCTIESIDYEHDQFTCRGYVSGRFRVHVPEELFALKHGVVDVEKPRGDSRFPHYCPRCNQPAYIGLATTEHRDTERDKGCH